MPAEISEISSCRLSCARRVVERKQLQVVDHNQFDILLRFQPARLRPQFQNLETGAVIDKNLSPRPALTRRRSD